MKDIQQRRAPDQAQLDEYVVDPGEDQKVVVSVAVYNGSTTTSARSWAGKPRRRPSPGRTRKKVTACEINILMIGPRQQPQGYYLGNPIAPGCWTCLAIANATSLTEAGYISGDDVEESVSGKAARSRCGLTMCGARRKESFSSVDR